MSSLFRIGQILKGKSGSYTIAKQVQSTVWFAKNHQEETVVIKSVQGHPRIENERDVLRRVQHRTPFLRPVIGDILEPLSPTAIALKHLESDLLAETVKRTLNRRELKHVCRCILEALKVLHEDNLVHTDVKLDNVFVNLQEGDDRFSEVQLGDLGGSYPADSEWATSGTTVGTPRWSSPEILMEIPWNTASDIWSFGTLLISLIYGGDLNLFRPKVKRDHEEYILHVVMQQYRYFGPFKPEIAEIVPPETGQSILWMMQELHDKMTPFSRTTEREVSRKDKEFIGKIMMLDWRDRPTAKDILEDEWWNDDDESGQALNTD